MSKLCSHEGIFWSLRLNWWTWRHLEDLLSSFKYVSAAQAMIQYDTMIQLYTIVAWSFHIFHHLLMHNTRKLSLREPLAPWEDREIATVWGRFCEGELTSAALLKLMPERHLLEKDMSTHQTSLSWLQDLVNCRFQLPEKTDEGDTSWHGHPDYFLQTESFSSHSRWLLRRGFGLGVSHFVSRCWGFCFSSLGPLRAPLRMRSDCRSKATAPKLLKRSKSGFPEAPPAHILQDGLQRKTNLEMLLLNASNH